VNSRVCGRGSIARRETQEAEQAMSPNSEHSYGFLGFPLVCSLNAILADW
jgi:hypothetical protein